MSEKEAKQLSNGRRGFLKKVAYVAPVVATMHVMPAMATNGSNHVPREYEKKPTHEFSPRKSSLKKSSLKKVKTKLKAERKGAKLFKAKKISAKKISAKKIKLKSNKRKSGRD